MSKRLHVGLGVFVAVWNVAASVLFAGSLVSPRLLGVAISFLGVPLLVLGGAGSGIDLGGTSFDDERTIGLGDALVGLGVILSMATPIVLGSADSTDVLVAGITAVAGGTLGVMGAFVAAGSLDLPE